MRTSAKLNLFLGVRNLSEEFLPPHLAYLQSFFRRRAMNPLLPFSVLGAQRGAGLSWCMAATEPTATPAAVVGTALVGTMLALAIVEHLLLVLPIPSTALWRWALRGQAPRQRPSTWKAMTISFAPAKPPVRWARCGPAYPGAQGADRTPPRRTARHRHRQRLRRPGRRGAPELQGLPRHGAREARRPGGRAGVWRQDGFTFDAGPTIVTAPFMLEELWALCGKRLADDVTLVPMDPFYRIRFDDGTHFDYSSDAAAMRAQIAPHQPVRRGRLRALRARRRSSATASASRSSAASPTTASATCCAPARTWCACAAGAACTRWWPRT